MKLENFTLQPYNDSVDHRCVLVKLWNDKTSKKYLYDLTREARYLEELSYEDERNRAYIVYLEEIPIGYISLKGEKDKFSISYGLIPEYRNNGIGSELLRQFTAKIFELYGSIHELVLIICSDNIPSKKIAIKNGYENEHSIKFTKKRKNAN